MTGSGTSHARDAGLLLDEMCGGVRGHLRMCGHDAAYAVERGLEGDDRILATAREEGRVLVTRDRELADRAEADPDCPAPILLTDRDVEEQLRELRAAGLTLELAERPARCGACNGTVERVTPTGAADGDGEGDGDAEGEEGGHGDGQGGRGDGDGHGEEGGGVPSYVPDGQEEVWRCVDCGQHFWRGTHWEEVAETLSEL